MVKDKNFVELETNRSKAYDFINKANSIENFIETNDLSEEDHNLEYLSILIKCRNFFSYKALMLFEENDFLDSFTLTLNEENLMHGCLHIMDKSIEEKQREEFHKKIIKENTYND